MGYFQPVPFSPKARHPELDQAIERAVALHEARLRLDAERGEAIRDALSKGATLRELAGELGVSPATVLKMSQK